MEIRKAYKVKPKIFKKNSEFCKDYSVKLSEKLGREINPQMVVAGLIAEGCTIYGSPWRNVQFALGGEYIWDGVDFAEIGKDLSKKSKLASEDEITSIESYITYRVKDTFDTYSEKTNLNKDDLATVLLNRTLYRDLERPYECETEEIVGPLSEILEVGENETKKILEEMNKYDREVSEKLLEEEMDSLEKLEE